MQKPQGARAHKQNRISAARLARAVLALVALMVLGLVGGFVAAASPSTTTASATTTTTFKPVADTRVQEATPATNYGTEKRLGSDGDAGKRIETALRFELSGLLGTVERARLRLYAVSDPTKDGPSLYLAGSGWTESSVTWTTRPQATGAAVADLGAVAAGTWVELDVTALVTGNGSLGMLLKQPGTDGVVFYSRERDGYQPELVVTTSDQPATTTGPPATSSSPRGIWTRSSTAPSEFPSIKSLGFGFVQVNPDRAQLDAVLAAGLKAMVWLGDYENTDGQGCYWNWSDDHIRTALTAVRGHPAIAFYFIADEPHAVCPNAVQDVRARNALVKNLDPSVPTFLTENRVEAIAPLANTADIMGLIGYPCSYANGCVYSKITARVDAANAAGVLHYWGVPQTFQEVGDTEYYRAPSPAELQAIFNTWEAPGSRIEGYFGYTWNCCGNDVGLRDHPELWDTWRAENGAG